MSVIGKSAGALFGALLLAQPVNAADSAPKAPSPGAMAVGGANAATQFGRPARKAARGLSGGGMSGPVLAVAGLGGAAVAAVASKGKSNASPR